MVPFFIQVSFCTLDSFFILLAWLFSLSHFCLCVDIIVLRFNGTDGIVSDVLKVSVVKYGKQWDGRETQKIVGKTPLEAAAAVVEDYELPCSTDDFLTKITPLLYDQ